MDPVTHARMVRFGDELVNLMNRHLDQLDHNAVDVVWRNGFAMFLATMIYHDQMSPAQVEQYLSRTCDELRLTTHELVREGDTEGWRPPEDARGPSMTSLSRHSCLSPRRPRADP